MRRRGEPDPGAGLSLEQLITQIDTRLDVLRPLVREFEQLESARAVLVADHGVGTRRARRSVRPGAASAARGRRAPRGANREAILRLAGERPGITVAEIATATGIGKPTVHSTVYTLTRGGALERAGDGIKLASSSSGALAGRSARRAEPGRRRVARRPAPRAARARRARRSTARHAAARRAPASVAPTVDAASSAAGRSTSVAEGARSVPPADDSTSAGR